MKTLIKGFVAALVLTAGVAAAQSSGPYSAQIQRAINALITGKTLVTSFLVKVGTSTDTGKVPIGDLYSQTYVDSGVQNQWNVMSVSLGGNALVNVGDTADIYFEAKHAANANNVEIQIFVNGGTCSGSGANCCASGTKTVDNQTATSGAPFVINDHITRTGSNAQNYYGFGIGATTLQSSEAVSLGLTDSAADVIVMCARNTAAAAAALTTTSPSPQLRVNVWNR